MKKISLLITLLFSISLLGQITPIKPLINLNKTSKSNSNESGASQLYKWEAYTKKGALVIGVNKSKADAEWVIKDFTKRNEKNVYKPIGFIIKKAKNNSIERFYTFKKKYPKGYKVLMPRDVIALRMIKVSGINDASDFIESVTKKEHSEAFEYVFKLSNDFKTYSINY